MNYDKSHRLTELRHVDKQNKLISSYGKGRASYLNNQTGDSYNYLTNQSGSVTGLTKDGQAVASTSYNLYGARKTSTDTTGNPFAYNGEARDDTGLDYLRARYYDSQGGTFLSEDSYPGEATDPLSQNRYSYVQNNPVNYTDPSGHFWNSIKKGWNYVKKTASNAWNGVKRVVSNTWNTVKRAASNTWNSVKSFASEAWNATKSAFNHATNWISTQYNRVSNWVGRQWNKVQTAYNSAVNYAQTKYQQTVAQIEAKRQQVVRSAYALATGLSSSPTTREGLNLYRNWNTALQNTLKHVCNPKTIGASDKGGTKVPSVADFRKYEDAARHGLRLDQKERIDRMTLEEYLKAPPMTPEENAYASNVKFAKFNQENKATLPTIAAEFIGWNNGERLVTGKDPLTGEEANRWAAGAELAVDIASNFYPIAKAGKLRKLEKALDAVDAVNDASKATKAVDKASDAARVVDKVDDVKDANKVMKSIDELSPKELQNMTLDEIKSTIPDNSGWAVYEHNGFVHIKKNGVDRIKLDPPDKVTTYPHMHIYDENKNLLNIDGKIVGRKDPAGHIPWNNGGS